MKQYDQTTLKNVKKLDPKAIQRSDKIGSGAFSVVYKGYLNERLVAIKDMNFANEREIEMWFREVEILGYAFSFLAWFLVGWFGLFVAVFLFIRMMQGTSFLVNIEGYCVTSEYMTIVMEFMHKVE
jgi:serine/threonine protein kinase